MTQSAREICRAVRDELEQATDSVLTAADQGARAIRRARGGESAALGELESVFCAILEACAFQDIVGQRLSQLEELVGGVIASRTSPADPLLNGPAAAGHGLDQTGADTLMLSLFSTADRTPE